MSSHHSKSLFRHEAVAAQSQRLVGTISLVQPFSFRFGILAIVILTCCVIVFLFNASYARKETVRGYLQPDKGIITSYSNRNGTVKEVFVQEGEYVERGEALLNVVSSQSLLTGEELSETLISEIRAQLLLVDDDAGQLLRLEQLEKQKINAQLDTLTTTVLLLQKQQLLLQKKEHLLDSQQQQYEQLSQRGFASKLQRQQQLEKSLTVRQDVEQLNTQLLQQQSQQQQLTFQLANISEEFLLKQRDLDRKKSELTRQLKQLENNFQYIIKASHSGVITSVQVVDGEMLNSARPLVSLLPDGAELIAQLLLPTRSAGFIQRGDVARIRFDAFPHQRFGIVDSKIIQIDQSIISDRERVLPIDITEPVYKIQSKLSQQVIKGYGNEFPLKSGMLLEADIILERRSLLQWLLDPIYSLSGRL
ncbi:HlyD family secretion protein [Psychrobium sp. 1_MG-2023]|uniref:HlyD family secretion protein n=1 Tax=Psychrobium sp. 1_MG-2023 TaxID=3062624 RepID=UPI000C3324BE|nr:HlyD family efflux transporter periplasmic adaptor subunit [Psychrobium sp. 1_MG-2023]MDP2560471.1 HlyD family efflux transporter periplasmic adaptor subunit [Psychrobium sp. 1_MG-2023]PKF57869.1 toxin secretion protein [Alteromonadales bacterium alter-6D02]